MQTDNVNNTMNNYKDDERLLWLIGTNDFLLMHNRVTYPKSSFIQSIFHLSPWLTPLLSISQFLWRTPDVCNVCSTQGVLSLLWEFFLDSLVIVLNYLQGLLRAVQRSSKYIFTYNRWALKTTFAMTETLANSEYSSTTYIILSSPL